MKPDISHPTRKWGTEHIQRSLHEVKACPSVGPNVSSPKLLKEFRLNLVLGLY